MKVISFVNMKGGVSKTTLCVNVGAELARRGKGVLIIDIDPQFNATQCLIKPEEYEKHLEANGDSILDIFDTGSKVSVSVTHGKKSQSAKKLKDITPITIKKQLDLLPGNLNLYKLDMAGGTGRENRLKKYLEVSNAADTYDFVLIDTPPTPSIWMTSALIASNYYVIPVKPDPISFTGIDLLNSVIEDLEDNLPIKIKCAGVVLTLAEEMTTVYKKCRTYLETHEAWKKYLIEECLPKRTEIARDQASQNLIPTGANSDTALRLKKIVDELLKRI